MDANVPTERPRSRRGFAAMDPEKQREIARKGGRASGGRPENLRGVDRREAGRKGGHAVVEKYGPAHMANIGRKGGQSSGGFARMDPERQREIASRGGRGGLAESPPTRTPSPEREGKRDAERKGEEGLTDKEEGLTQREERLTEKEEGLATSTAARSPGAANDAETSDHRTLKATASREGSREPEEEGEAAQGTA